MKWYQQKPTILKLDRCRTKTPTTPNMRCFIPTLHFTDDHISRYWYRTKVRTTLTIRSFGIARLFFSKILKSDRCRTKVRTTPKTLSKEGRVFKRTRGNESTESPLPRISMLGNARVCWCELLSAKCPRPRLLQSNQH